MSISKSFVTGNVWNLFWGLKIQGSHNSSLISFGPSRKIYEFQKWKSSFFFLYIYIRSLYSKMAPVKLYSFVSSKPKRKMVEKKRMGWLRVGDAASIRMRQRPHCNFCTTHPLLQTSHSYKPPTPTNRSKILLWRWQTKTTAYGQPFKELN